MPLNLHIYSQRRNEVIRQHHPILERKTGLHIKDRLLVTKKYPATVLASACALAAARHVASAITARRFEVVEGEVLDLDFLHGPQIYSLNMTNMGPKSAEALQF